MSEYQSAASGAEEHTGRHPEEDVTGHPAHEASAPGSSVGAEGGDEGPSHLEWIDARLLEAHERKTRSSVQLTEDNEDRLTQMYLTLKRRGRYPKRNISTSSMANVAIELLYRELMGVDPDDETPGP